MTLSEPLGGSWPAYDAGPAEHAHALGILSMNYNNLEWILLMFHLYYSGAPHPVIGVAFEKLSNDARLELLKKIVQCNVKDAAIIKNIEDFIGGFKACATNRNTLLHSQVISSRGVESDDVLTTTKRSKSGNLSSYQFTLPEIRRVADEIHEWYMFGNLTLFYAFHSSRSSTRAPPSLPQKPKAPTTLNPKS